MGKDATYRLAVDEPGGYLRPTSLKLRTAFDTHYYAHISVSWPRVQRTLSCTDCGRNEDPIQSFPHLEIAVAYDVVQNQSAAIELHANHFFSHCLWFCLPPKDV
jgi:hypothetical protein